MEEALEYLKELKGVWPRDWSLAQLDKAIAALSAPCPICGGKEPLAVEKGRLYEDGGPGWCDLAIEQWIEAEPQDVRILIFDALPAKEEGS